MYSNIDYIFFFFLLGHYLEISEDLYVILLKWRNNVSMNNELLHCWTLNANEKEILLPHFKDVWCFIDIKNHFEGRHLTKNELLSFLSVTQILEVKKKCEQKYSFLMSFLLQIEHFSAWLILPKRGVIQTALVQEFRNFSVLLFKVKSFYFSRLSKQTPEGWYKFRKDIEFLREIEYLTKTFIYGMIYKIGIKIDFPISSFF